MRMLTDQQMDYLSIEDVKTNLQDIGEHIAGINGDREL